MTEKTGKEELRELARGLRRRVEFGDVEWSAGSARASERAAAPGEALAAAPGGVGAALEGLASQVEACRKCPLGSR
ncbi:MAG: hypothetical protein KGK30_06875, partial [Elusimicrobia bacterium]|nr:hypothetical protein [Elusimicrobiota bacterium]